MAHCGCALPNSLTQQRIEDLKKAGALAEQVRYSGDLSIKDRSYRLRTYKNCFVASDLVDCLIRMREASDRQSAVALGQLLVDTDYIHHVVDEHNFQDGFLFFRFRLDDRPGRAIEGPSAAYLRGQEGALGNMFSKRRTLGWVQYYFALSPVKKVLYQFQTELESSPLSCWSMKGVKVQPALPSTVGGRYTLQFVIPGQKDLDLGTESSEVQLAWLGALDDMGVEILMSTDEQEEKVRSAKSIFEFEAKTIDGELVSLEKYRGHVTLIVNVASQWGLAEKNYTQLVQLHREYAGRRMGLRILAFPCNQFGKQEPGTAQEIKAFAANHGVEFDIFAKIDVNGSHTHPLYRFLKSRVHKGLGSFIKWNYEKFLCDADGIPVKRHYPTTAPLDILPDIEKLWSNASRSKSVRI